MQEPSQKSNRSFVRTAVVGCGYLGKFHIEKLSQLPDSKLIAVVDTDMTRAQSFAQQYGVQAYDDYHQLFGQVDAVSIVTPTVTHFSIAKTFLEQGIHILLEKPITHEIAEADVLISLAEKNRCVLQIGHLERFNSAVLGLSGLLTTPRFIETHRLAPFKLRATDVNVVLDLMIHDIDIILHLVGDDVVNIDANGAKVLSDSTDIANARIRFANGCVANVTASRVSLKTERKMRIFQNDAYISVDFQNRILSHHYKQAGGNDLDLPKIASHETIYENSDALKTEIAAFIGCVLHGTPPLVSGKDGRRALETAMHITEMLEKQE